MFEAQKLGGSRVNIVSEEAGKMQVYNEYFTSLVQVMVNKNCKIMDGLHLLGGAQIYD